MRFARFASNNSRAACMHLPQSPPSVSLCKQHNKQKASLHEGTRGRLHTSIMSPSYTILLTLLLLQNGAASLSPDLHEVTPRGARSSPMGCSPAKHCRQTNLDARPSIRVASTFPSFSSPSCPVPQSQSPVPVCFWISISLFWVTLWSACCFWYLGPPRNASGAWFRGGDGLSQPQGLGNDVCEDLPPSHDSRSATSPPAHPLHPASPVASHKVAGTKPFPSPEMLSQPFGYCYHCCLCIALLTHRQTEPSWCVCVASAFIVGCPEQSRPLWPVSRLTSCAFGHLAVPR
jgi:hypothetical protein